MEESEWRQLTINENSNRNSISRNEFVPVLGQEVKNLIQMEYIRGKRATLNTATASKALLRAKMLAQLTISSRRKRSERGPC